MNNKYLNIALSILIICFGFIYYFVSKKNATPSESNCKINLEELSNKNKVEIANNYDFLDPSIELQDLNGKKIQIGELMSDKKLIFRYSVIHCSSCVYEKIHVLDSIYKIGIKDIIVIAHYDNLRNLLVDCKTNNYTLPIYILSENLITELDNLDVPQFILLDRDMLINQVFIPGFSTKLDELFLVSAIKFLQY